MRVRTIKALAVLACCALAVVAFSNSASAISESKLELFAANNIFFYDPGEGSTSGACKINSNSGSSPLTDRFKLTTQISGSTIEEKIWNGLKKLDVTDVVAAGIMGNMYYESSLNPARHETSKRNKYWPMALNEHTDISYGIGLIQWSFGRRKKVYNYIAEQEPGLENTFLNHPEIYSTKPSVSGQGFLDTAKDNGLSEKADRLLELELDYLVNKEMRVYNSYKKVFDETSVQGAAQRFSINVEGCANCRDVNNQSVKNRVAKAKEFYEKFNGTGDTGDDEDEIQCSTDHGEDDDGSGGSDDGNPYGEGGYQGDDYTYTGDVDSLQHLVKEWAWGKYYKNAGRSISEQTPAYRTHSPKYGGCQGNDCGGFVADTIKTSGWDPNFKYQGVRYMQDTLWSSSTWKEVTSQIHGDGDMQPGDIIICSHNSRHHSKKCGEGNIGHVMLWVGDISGFSSKIASASYNNNGKPCSGTRAPSASSSSGNIMHHINDSGYSIYRKVR